RFPTPSVIIGSESHVSRREPMATVWSRPIARRTWTRRTTRLISSAVVLLGTFFMGMGTSWDINWHATVGRDSFWIPPHLVLYGGTLLALGGIVFGFAAEAVRRGVPLGTVRPPAGMWVTTA